MSGNRGNWPSDEVLRGWLLTMTRDEIAQQVGVTKYALQKHLTRRGLIGVSPHGKQKQFASTVHHDRVEAEFTNVEAIRMPMGPAAAGALSYWVQRGYWVLGGDEPCPA